MLDAPLERVVQQLRAAFPAGVSEQDFEPLMVVLWEGLSQRNLGLVMEEFSGVDRDEIAHLATVAYNKRRALQHRVTEIEALLAQHGWDPDED